MDDGLAHGIHSEGLARLDLDQALDLRIPDCLPAGPKHGVPHRAAEQVVRHLAVGRAPEPRQDGDRREEGPEQRARGHLKTYRTRTSRA